ncbi:MAG: hypothetical protein Q9167_001831 [Letrouitia subvulpina]
MEVLPASQFPIRMPSPTLTNPDMILPETSPQKKIERLSALPQWSESSVSDEGQMKLRNILGNGHRVRRKGSEQRLEDVEVRRNYSELDQKGGSSAIASSPLLHEDFPVNKMGDTLSPDAGKENWDGFDDVSVISEGVSPLVDSERGDYLMSENGGLNGYKFSERFRTAIAEEDEEPSSHAAMSVRAEQILANAKKRLNEMESNLNRARHTINRPSSSMSSFLSRSPDRQSLYTIPKSLSPSKHRQQSSPTSNGKGHIRVFSETSVPSSMQSATPDANGNVEGARSSSAMGAVETDPAAEQSSKQGPEASRDWFWNGLNRSTSTRHNYGLQPLNEDGPPLSTFEPSERQDTPSVFHDTAASAPVEQQGSSTSTLDRSNLPTSGLTRARSTNQMRDIRDQMQDLKGKISSLKQKAKEDSLRRRSLQTLRTPSPFTAAEQWYAEAPGYPRDRSRSRPRENSPPTIQETAEENENDEGSKQSSAQETTPILNRNVLRDSQGSAEASDRTRPHEGPSRKADDSPNTVIDAPSSESNLIQIDEIGPEKKTETADTADGLEDDNEDFHESSTSPVGERHEDRPDAFDYEHFFLHSGMGTIERGRKSRSSSHSSSSSVETTKPNRVIIEEPNEIGSDGTMNVTPRTMGVDSQLLEISHARKGSVESVSTVATFATATEGKSSDEDTEEDEWVYTRPMAGSWEPEYPSHRKVTVGRENAPQLRGQGTTHSAQARSPPVPERSDSQAARDSTDTVKGVEASQDVPVPVPGLLAFLSTKLPLSQEEKGQKQIELSESDKELADRLAKSLAKVCWQLQVASQQGGKYEGRVWRRRLDAARRVLDGEVNGEAF